MDRGVGEPASVRTTSMTPFLSRNGHGGRDVFAIARHEGRSSQPERFLEAHWATRAAGSIQNCIPQSMAPAVASTILPSCGLSQKLAGRRRDGMNVGQTQGSKPGRPRS
jgi:hypothetical protein